MTADKPMTREKCIEWMADITHESIATDTIRKHVDEVIFAESKRCAARVRSGVCGGTTTVNQRDLLANDLLITSPGKGGG